MRQKRWSCGECHREWLRAKVPVAGGAFRDWSDGDQCPACGSQQVALVEYRPLFPGADIGTTPADAPSMFGAIAPALPPPRTEDHAATPLVIGAASVGDDGAEYVAQLSALLGVAL